VGLPPLTGDPIVYSTFIGQELFEQEMRRR
jgi:hypothetical protein